MGKKHTWTPAQVTALLMDYRHHVVQGKAAGAGLKKKEWGAMVETFNKRFKTSVTVQTLKNKVAVEKQKLSLCLKLEKKSGWTFNAEICAPTADASVISDYLKFLEEEDKKKGSKYGSKAAKARDVITNGVRNYDILLELFEGSMASGDKARSSTQAVTMSKSKSTRLVAQENDDSGSENAFGSDGADGDDGDDGDNGDDGDDGDDGDVNNRVNATGDDDASDDDDLMPPLQKPRSSLSLSTEPAKIGLDGLSEQIDRALNQLDNIGNSGAVATSLRLPEGVQLTVVVAKKLDELLSRFNSVYDGTECNWLLPKLTYKYAKAFSDPLLAGMFLGTTNDEALVGFLEDVFKSMQ